MNYTQFIFIIVSLLKYTFSKSIECKNGQFYDLLEENCKDCSSECSTCYDKSDQSCLSCTDGYKYDFQNQKCIPKCQNNQIEFNNQCALCQVENCIQCDKQFQCDRCDRGYILVNKNKCIPNCPESQVLEDVCKYQCSNNFLDIEKRQCLEKQYCPYTVRYNNYCNYNIILNAIIYDDLLYTFDNGGYVQVFKYPSHNYVTQKLFSSENQVVTWIFLDVSKKKVISISSTQIYLIDLEIFAILNSIQIPYQPIFPNTQILLNQKMYITPNGSNLLIIDFPKFTQTSLQLKEDIYLALKIWDTKTKNLIIQIDEFTFDYIDTTQNSVIQVSCEKCQGVSSFYLTNNIFVGNLYQQTKMRVFYLNLTEISGDLIFQRELPMKGLVIFQKLLPPNYV